MATNLQDLISKLQSTNTPYTALTAEAIQKQAQDRYAAAYDQKELSARQQYENDSAVLGRQLAEMQSDYGKQRDDTAQQYKSLYAQTNRQSMTRNMQRSSYTNAALAGVDQQGLRARQDINDSQQKQENAIGEQHTSLAQQLAQQINEYNAQEQSDVMAYREKLEEREYGRTTSNQSTQNDIASKIYEYQHQLEQEAEDKRRWEEEIALQRQAAR